MKDARAKERSTNCGKLAVCPEIRTPNRTGLEQNPFHGVLEVKCILIVTDELH
jgi:hypothetical protein